MEALATAASAQDLHTLFPTGFIRLSFHVMGPGRRHRCSVCRNGTLAFVAQARMSRALVISALAILYSTYGHPARAADIVDQLPQLSERLGGAAAWNTASCAAPPPCGVAT